MATAVDQTADVVQVARDAMHSLRGRLFQTIEAMGLPEQQTDAAKGLVRSATYEAQSEMEAAIRKRLD